MLKVGDKLPAGSLQEFIEVEGNGCSIGPNTFKVEEITAAKKIAIFALPGAYTPLARPSMCRAMSNKPRPSRLPGLMKYGACRSTMLS